VKLIFQGYLGISDFKCQLFPYFSLGISQFHQFLFSSVFTVLLNNSHFHFSLHLSFWSATLNSFWNKLNNDFFIAFTLIFKIPERSRYLNFCKSYFLFLSHFTSIWNQLKWLKHVRVLIFLWRVFPSLKWAKKEVFIFMKDMNFWRRHTCSTRQGKKGLESLVANMHRKKWYDWSI